METAILKKFECRDSEAISMLASFKEKPAMSKELEKILLTFVLLARSEQGSIAYVSYCSPENSDELMLEKIFSSYCTFTEHGQKNILTSRALG
jgi:quinol monooxygenase YgiN